MFGRKVVFRHGWPVVLVVALLFALGLGSISPVLAGHLPDAANAAAGAARQNEERVLPTVELRNADGEVVGEADLTRTRRGRLLVELEATGFDPAEHRLAIKEVGRCEAGDLDTAGEEILNLSSAGFTPVQAPAIVEALEIELEDLTGNAAAFAGQRVQVTGEVAEVADMATLAAMAGVRTVPATAFTLRTDEPTDNEVLVLSAGEADVPMNLQQFRGSEVTVIGTALPFRIAEFEQPLGIDLPDWLLARFEGGPLIIADSVEPVAAVEVTETRQIQVEELTGNAAAFAGQRVQATAKLADVLDMTGMVQVPSTLLSAFILESDERTDNQVLVVSVAEADVPMNLQRFRGDEVTVTGTVFVFRLRQLERQLGVDLPEQILGGFEGGPLIVADSVVPAVETEPRPTRAAEAGEFFVLIDRFDAEALFEEDGSALVLHAGLDPESEIIACGVIVPAEDRAGEADLTEEGEELLLP